MMKNIFYLIFTGFFYIFSLCPLKNNKVTFIMTHDKDLDGNIGYVYKNLKKNNFDLDYNFITRNDYKIEPSLNSVFNIIKFFIVKSYHLSTSKYIFLDNVFLPSSYIKYKKDVKIIQLWHGSGTIKKFGQDVNKGILARLEKRANSTYTHLIVNSKKIVDVYSGAFNISNKKIFPTGSPRTDFFFDDKLMSDSINKFYEKYPQFKKKKIILYAPTFRDNDVNDPSFSIDFKKIKQELGQDYIIFLRLHPFIANKFNLDKKYSDYVFDFSKYKDLNTLLLISDLLITDYSSIMFEYSLLKKPMIFYCYDLEEYGEQIRGFYYEYKDFVPGSICYNLEEIIDVIKYEKYNMNKLNSFISNYFDFYDGKSTERVINMIFDN